ncbi:MAG: HAMP domain-containing histidine kinase, partial [Bdellovibrionales bacterium]|nr:HAMP domain-containing histidine kinase [Bdellovibrionales bacterium]
ITAISANAAHEINTPLATIELISHELKNLTNNTKNLKAEDLVADLEILKDQAARCKSIINKMCSNYGHISGEMLELVSFDQLKEILELEHTTREAKINWSVLAHEKVLIPKEAVLIAIKSLISNALEAQNAVDTNKAITVEFRLNGNQVNVLVRDHGKGIDQEILENLGTPFFTTKNNGMGLGVYIAKLVAERIGGLINFNSSPGEGTIVNFSFPLAQARIKAA